MTSSAPRSLALRMRDAKWATNSNPWVLCQGNPLIARWRSLFQLHQSISCRGVFISCHLGNCDRWYPINGSLNDNGTGPLINVASFLTTQIYVFIPGDRVSATYLSGLVWRCNKISLIPWNCRLIDLFHLIRMVSDGRSPSEWMAVNWIHNGSNSNNRPVTFCATGTPASGEPINITQGWSD